ncbi:hypothetical protein KA036_01200 [Candidatus Gracilibacteria bacterium]|jgi:hypothetical protein|nr:hypothetical protein [Candidatus Gracilibacteria bacterium]
MSEFGGLESFSIEGNEGGVDQAALERLREAMARAREQAAKDQKSEQKQRKSEGDLSEIIKALLKHQDVQGGFLTVILKAMAVNIPAFFILAILSLRFESIRPHVGLKFPESLPNEAEFSNTALVPANFSTDAVLPLKIRIEVDIWLKFLITTAVSELVLVLNRIREDEAGTAGANYASTPLKNLISFTLQDYLELNKQTYQGGNIVSFVGNFSDSLVEYLSDQVKGQKQLG